MIIFISVFDSPTSIVSLCYKIFQYASIFLSHHFNIQSIIFGLPIELFLCAHGQKQDEEEYHHLC